MGGEYSCLECIADNAIERQAVAGLEALDALLDLGSKALDMPALAEGRPNHQALAELGDGGIVHADLELTWC